MQFATPDADYGNTKEHEDALKSFGIVTDIILFILYLILKFLCRARHR